MVGSTCEQSRGRKSERRSDQTEIVGSRKSGPRPENLRGAFSNTTNRVVLRKKRHRAGDVQGVRENAHGGRMGEALMNEVRFVTSPETDEIRRGSTRKSGEKP